MQDLFRLADDLQSFCQDRGWRFCFIGGIAIQRWGEPRLTAEVDLTILTGCGGEAAFVEELCGAFPGGRRTRPSSRTGAACSSSSPSAAFR